ncbi:glycosyltransferase family 2 protein [Sinimarinibacterium flocculans]|uniref:glycosyltransferase family 2 protein n=1 Tax=Sinimarinibacterium flocculans TaxID=985250 RepID=UPI0035118A6C
MAATGMRPRSLPRRVARRLLETLGLRTPDTSRDVDYAAWAARVEPRAGELQRLAARAARGGPLISVVMPVYNPDMTHLREAVASVQAQAYPHWQLCLCNDASTDPAVAPFLDALAAAEPRVRLQHRLHNGGIGLASADAAALADGEFLALLDQDDRLPAWALAFVARALADRPDTDLLYTDEDKFDDSGRRHSPHFKPAFNPELLAAINYVGHLLVVRRSLYVAVDGFRGGFDGAQDYDLVLRCTAAITPDRIAHLPAVLYHWRAHAGSTARDAGRKPYAQAAGVAALTAIHGAADATVAEGPLPTSYRVVRPRANPPPRVTVMIPTRDGGAHLQKCLDSLLGRTAYPRMELLILDNQSRDPRTLRLLERAGRREGVQVLAYDHPFNYSAINNFGARHAQGEVLVLLNDDIVVRGNDWLDQMLAALMLPGVGVVGAKLHYPDGRVQHGGVVLGIGGVAGHAHKYFPRRHAGYFGRLALPQAVSAVTGACLMVRRETYEALGGLDEQHLAVAFNDVDFCLRVRERGLRCVWTPYAELTHLESASRGDDETGERHRRFQREAVYMKRRWASELREDPFYSPYLTLRREDFSLGETPPGYLSRLTAGAR